MEVCGDTCSLPSAADTSARISPLFSFRWETSSPPPRDSPLGCILRNWSRFDPRVLKKKLLVSLCNNVWPQYKLNDQRVWPGNGTLDSNTISCLYLYCREHGKWTEIPYVQVFMALRKDHELCQSCRLDSAMLTSFELLSGVHCKAEPKEPPSSAPLDAPEPPRPQPPVEPTAPPRPPRGSAEHQAEPEPQPEAEHRRELGR